MLPCVGDLVCLTSTRALSPKAPGAQVCTRLPSYFHSNAQQKCSLFPDSAMPQYLENPLYSRRVLCHNALLASEQSCVGAAYLVPRSPVSSFSYGHFRQEFQSEQDTVCFASDLPGVDRETVGSLGGCRTPCFIPANGHM